MVALDLLSRYWLCSCFRSAAISNTRMAAFPSVYVYRIGSFGDISSLAWTLAVWIPPNVSTDGSLVGAFARLAVRYWSRNLCCKRHSKPQSLWVMITDRDKNRVPEKWHPGMYDVIGSSHQIFHVFVVLAAISHMMGLLKAFDYRHGFLGGLCLKV